MSIFSDRLRISKLLICRCVCVSVVRLFLLSHNFRLQQNRLSPWIVSSYESNSVYFAHTKGLLFSTLSIYFFLVWKNPTEKRNWLFEWVICTFCQLNGFIWLSTTHSRTHTRTKRAKSFISIYIHNWLSVSYRWSVISVKMYRDNWMYLRGRCRCMIFMHFHLTIFVGFAERRENNFSLHAQHRQQQQQHIFSEFTQLQRWTVSNRELYIYFSPFSFWDSTLKNPFSMKMSMCMSVCEHRSPVSRSVIKPFEIGFFGFCLRVHFGSVPCRLFELLIWLTNVWPCVSECECLCVCPCVFVYFQFLGTTKYREIEKRRESESTSTEMQTKQLSMSRQTASSVTSFHFFCVVHRFCFNFPLSLSLLIVFPSNECSLHAIVLPSLVSPLFVMIIIVMFTWPVPESSTYRHTRSCSQRKRKEITKNMWGN